MELSKINLPNSITHLTIVGDNATNIEHIEHYHEAESILTSKRLSEKEEETLASKIEDCFKDKDGKTRHEWAIEFIRIISGTNNSNVTATVFDWSSDNKNRIIPNMKSWRCLGKPLYDAGLYTTNSKNGEKGAESNWNQRIN